MRTPTRQQQILAWLLLHPNHGVKSPQIATETDMPLSSASLGLADLARKGKIVKIAIGGHYFYSYGTPETYQLARGGEEVTLLGLHKWGLY